MANVVRWEPSNTQGGPDAFNLAAGLGYEIYDTWKDHMDNLPPLNSSDNTRKEEHYIPTPIEK
jgi:hypothetical protein